MFGFLSGAHPVFYMTVLVLSASSTSVLYKLGNAADSPFLFTGLWQAFTGLGLGLAVLLVKGKSLLDPHVARGVLSSCKFGFMLVCIVGECGFVLFAVGLALVDVSVATVLYQTWPVFLMLITLFLFRNTNRYRSVSTGNWLFVGLALAGVVLGVMSQNEMPRPLLSIGHGLASPGALLGAGLVLAAAILAAANIACTFRLGAMLAKANDVTTDRRTGEILFATVVTSMAMTVAGLVLCAIGIAVSETLSARNVAYAVPGALLVNVVGVCALRAANLKTDNLGVNALACATPLVALVWLHAFSTIDVFHMDYLVIGAVAIVSANLIIMSGTSRIVSYRALVFSLWLFGSCMYFNARHSVDTDISTLSATTILCAVGLGVFLFFGAVDSHRGDERVPNLPSPSGQAVPIVTSAGLVIVFAVLFAMS